eukprot:3472348-Amphidinium_carterae.1
MCWRECVLAGKTEDGVARQRRSKDRLQKVNSELQSCARYTPQILDYVNVSRLVLRKTLPGTDPQPPNF